MHVASKTQHNAASLQHYLQVLTCSQLDELSGKQLFFKAEIFQVRHTAD
jgi:hypothetical protein